ncbi:DUF2285 domain-containing protein [Paremcibacter congregatus]|uniref:T6SS Transcription factor RovC-like DNA binding domain-containing protein n=1 Tax=Paremcibacter congregatus TaxID=2043170 RepID=A0A2G4YWL6_9PROT|nr:DUF2285 domain-containing protein [Paremcibacter congregatus]PHZ86728.1 hypothetical protein CRD36_00300 [Paremcibacter congregatus]QDE27622.1 DUF2285 domain-containing protein [Paremcibacter congregatus]
MPHNGQHLLLTDGQYNSHVLCQGDDIRCDPILIELIVDNIWNCGPQLKAIKLFADHCRGKSLAHHSSNNPPSCNHRRTPDMTHKNTWTVEGRRNRDALVALDKRMAGWSYREIGIFLYGKQAVGEDWNDPNQTMKNRLIRSVKRGIRFRDGGYKSLIH